MRVSKEQTLDLDEVMILRADLGGIKVRVWFGLLTELCVGGLLEAFFTDCYVRGNLLSKQKRKLSTPKPKARIHHVPWAREQPTPTVK